MCGEGVGGKWTFNEISFTFTSSKIFVQTSNKYEENGYIHELDLLIIIH